MRGSTLKITLFVAVVLVVVLGCANMALAANSPCPAVKLTQYFTVNSNPDAGHVRWTDNLITSKDFGWTRITAYDANGNITSASNVKVQMIGPWSKTFQPGVPDLVEQPWPAAVTLSNPNVGLQGQRTVPEFFGNQVAGNYWVTGTYRIIAWIDSNSNNAIDPGEVTANINTIRLFRPGQKVQTTPVAGTVASLSQYFTVNSNPNANRVRWTDNLITSKDFGWTRITAYDANGSITSASNVKVQMIGPWSKTFQPGVPDLVEQPWPAAVTLSNPNVGLQGQRTVPEFFGNQVAGNYWVFGTYTILAWADANGNNAIDPGEAIANVNTLHLVDGCEGHCSH